MSAEDIVIKLRECLYPIKRILFAILYGSVARKSTHGDSDVDIAIFASDGLKLDERIELIYRLAKCLGITEDRIDLVLLNEDTPLELRYKIFRDGILIFSRDQELYRRYRDESISLYLDYKLALKTVNYGKKYLEKIEAELHGAKR